MGTKFLGVEFTDHSPLVTEAAVASLERQIGIPLPDDYKRFLLEVNGGTPDPACYQDADVAEELDDDSAFEYLAKRRQGDPQLLEVARYAVYPSVIERFVGLEPGTLRNDLQSWVDNSRLSRENDVSSFLLIALDTVGTGVFLSLSDENYGRIYDFRGDWSDYAVDDDDDFIELDPLDEMESLILAGSFSEFIQGLRPSVARFRQGFEPTAAHWAILRLQGYLTPEEVEE